MTPLQKDGIKFVDGELRRFARLITDAGALLIGVHQVTRALELPLPDADIDLGAVLLQVGDCLDAIQHDHYAVLFPAAAQTQVQADLGARIRVDLASSNTSEARASSAGAAGAASRAVPAALEKAAA